MPDTHLLMTPRQEQELIKTLFQAGRLITQVPENKQVMDTTWKPTPWNQECFGTLSVHRSPHMTKSVIIGPDGINARFSSPWSVPCDVKMCLRQEWWKNNCQPIIHLYCGIWPLIDIQYRPAEVTRVTAHVQSTVKGTAKLWFHSVQVIRYW